MSATTPESSRWMEHRRAHHGQPQETALPADVEYAEGSSLPMPVRSNSNARTRGAVVEYTDEQAALQRANVAELILKRVPQHEIIRRLHIAAPQVRKIRKQLEAEWIERSGVSFDLHKARELNELDRLQDKYEDAYEASKQKKTKQRIDYDYLDAKKDLPKGAVAGEARSRRARTQAVQVDEEPEGDPRFLDGILRCIDRRIKLLGLDEPEKYNIGVGVEGKGNGRTAVEDRFTTALRLVGVAFSVSESETPGGAADGDGPGEPVDSRHSYIEASGVLAPG